MVAEWYIIACGGDAVALRIELGLRKRSEGGSSRECQYSNPIWDVGLATQYSIPLAPAQPSAPAIAAFAGHLGCRSREKYQLVT